MVKRFGRRYPRVKEWIVGLSGETAIGPLVLRFLLGFSSTQFFENSNLVTPAIAADIRHLLCRLALL